MCPSVWEGDLGDLPCSNFNTDPCLFTPHCYHLGTTYRYALATQLMHMLCSLRTELLEGIMESLNYKNKAQWFLRL